jgi:hypothetical protein
MKLRTIKLSALLFEEMLRGECPKFKSNLPKNIKFLDAKFDPIFQCIEFIVQSDEFEDIPDTYPIPHFEVICYRKEES